MQAERRAAVWAALAEAEAQAQAFLITFLPNVRYLSGFTGSNAMLLLMEESAILFTDPRYTIRASQESDCEVKIVRGPVHLAALPLWKRRKWRRVGFEARRMDHASFLELEKDAPGKLVPVTGIVERLRSIKSADEIERIRTSVNTNSEAYERAL